MKVSVAQCLVDSGDPLALAMVADGASTFKLKPVSEWLYTIYKVTYFRGGECGDEENSRVVLVAYVLSADNWIENDAEEHGPDCSWMKWEVVEEDIKPPRRKTDTGHTELLGWGRHDSVIALKENYRITNVFGTRRKRTIV